MGNQKFKTNKKRTDFLEVFRSPDLRKTKKKSKNLQIHIGTYVVVIV
jgi:hypothetical protein